MRRVLAVAVVLLLAGAATGLICGKLARQQAAVARLRQETAELEAQLKALAELERLEEEEAELKVEVQQRRAELEKSTAKIAALCHLATLAGLMVIEGAIDDAGGGTSRTATLADGQTLRYAVGKEAVGEDEMGIEFYPEAIIDRTGSVRDVDTGQSFSGAILTVPDALADVAAFYKAEYPDAAMEETRLTVKLDIGEEADATSIVATRISPEDVTTITISVGDTDIIRRPDTSPPGS